MRFIAPFIVYLLLAISGQLVAEWWVILPAGFLAGWFFRAKPSFLVGFLAIFLLWAGYAYWLDAQNASLLSSKVAGLFPVNTGPYGMIALTGLIGGIAGGLAVSSGSLMRAALQPQKRRR